MRVNILTVFALVLALLCSVEHVKAYIAIKESKERIKKLRRERKSVPALRNRTHVTSGLLTGHHLPITALLRSNSLKVNPKKKANKKRARDEDEDYVDNTTSTTKRQTKRKEQEAQVPCPPVDLPRYESLGLCSVQDLLNQL